MISNPPDHDHFNDEELQYRLAVEHVVKQQKASTSFIQRHLQIGYNRAARHMERMEREGVVTAPDREGKRNVLVKP